MGFLMDLNFLFSKNLIFFVLKQISLTNFSQKTFHRKMVVVGDWQIYEVMFPHLN